MAFGLTNAGFEVKRLNDIKEELESSLRASFGPGINLLPTELLGQFVGMFSEREALLWEALKAVYDAFYPDTASDLNLDNVVAITGIKRLEATRGLGTVTAYGTLGTVIPAGSVVSVAGNPTSRFLTTIEATIAAGTNEVQLIQFSAVPTSGSWTLIFDGDETGVLAFNDNAAAIQTALNSLPSLSAVTVSGNYTTGFSVTFAGADGAVNQDLIVAGTNTLTATAIQVNLSFSTTTQGVLPNVSIPVQAESVGAIQAYANTLTVIETPISGWATANNLTDITPGNDIETDSALRIRRNRTLSTAGAGTVEAIKSRILEIDEVENARVFENDTDVVDGFGRPAHSFEAVVLGGDDQEILDTIWQVKPAGIRSFGEVSGSIVDSMGFTHTVQFSRPTPVPIYVIVNIVSNPAEFPVGGAVAIQEAIVDFSIETFGIGDDVIMIKLFSAIDDIAGILDADFLIGTAPGPTLDTNIAIADDQISDWDTVRITVNVI
jgi:uncharacterized phage protein gp47/JayE